MAELEDDLELDKAVVFAILMAHGDGLDMKAPDYVKGKWKGVQGCRNRMEAVSFLDVFGQRIFYRWREQWFKKPDAPFATSTSDPSNEEPKQTTGFAACSLHGYTSCYVQEDGNHVGIGTCSCATFPTEDCKIDIHRLAAIERATTGHRTIGPG